MELLWVDDIPSWLLSSLCCLIMLYVYLTWTFDTFKTMGLPYEKPIPIFGTIFAPSHTHGSLFQPMSMCEQQMLMLEKYPGLTYGTFEGRTPVLQSSDGEVIKQIAIQNFSQFTNRPNVLGMIDEPLIKYVMFTTRDEHWKHVRATINPVFSTGKIKQMLAAIADCADRLVMHLKSSDRAPIKLKDYLSGFTMDVIARTAFGLDIDTQSTTDHPFIKHAGTFFLVPKDKGFYNTLKAKSAFYTIALVPSCIHWLLHKLFKLSFFDEESIAYFTDVTNRILKEELSQPSNKNNFVSMCTSKLVDPNVLPASQARKDNGILWSPEGLLREDILAQATLFLTAGYETTASNLEFFFYCMAFYPEIQHKLHDEIMKESLEEEVELSYERINSLPYLDSCVRESLRMYPPAIILDRIASEDVTVKGVKYPKGMIVHLQVYAVHHNPNYWPDPDTFKPERFFPENRTPEQQYTWLPFGLGNRNCVGMRLALLEVKLAVYKMIKEFRFEKTESTVLPSKMKFEPRTRFLRTEVPIELCVIPRY